MKSISDLRVLIVDDHTLFLEGMVNLLSSEGIEVVGTGHDGFDALNKARRLKPNLILMDIQMPRCDGVAATRLIKAEMPEIKIVILTMLEDEENLFDAVRSGASGFLMKNVDTEDFLDYLKDLQKGHPPFSPGLAEKILGAFSTQEVRPAAERKEIPANRVSKLNCDDKLSSRQLQILTLVSQGHTYREVAEALSITERTVKYHMGEIVNCLHLKNRSQVIAYAAQMGLSHPKNLK